MITPPNSIRWRLPLSYVAIALFTVLALGIVLLTILRGYYLQRERVYLVERGQVIGAILAPILPPILTPDRQAGNDPALLTTQLASLAFLSQVRIQLLDVQGAIVADSGSPPLRAAFQLPAPGPVLAGNETKLIIQNDVVTQSVTGFNDGQVITNQVMISLTLPDGNPNQPTAADLDFVFQAPVLDLFGQGSLAGEGDVARGDMGSQRSVQIVRQPVEDGQGQVIAIVQVSEGPAYGRQIVSSAAWGVLAAGVIAILLATLVGWWISRQLSVPLAQLTAATTQMAAGDLSVRANLQRQDELGALAHSFNEMAQRVDDTVAALRRFVADAAHELNTPLTALRTNLELEPTTPLNDERLRQVMRLEGLIKNLLMLSRLDAQNSSTLGAPALQHEPIDLTSLILVLCEPFASRAEQSEINFLLDLPETPIMIQGNRGLLHQALSNLLDNALKFSQAGGTVSLQLWDRGRLIQCLVEDDGIGVPVGDAPLLFQRFYRASNAAAYPGNGLGLAIVKAIIEQHGGSVVAERKEPGMRFVLTFSLQREDVTKK